MRTSRTSSSMCRMCAPAPALPTGTRSSWPTSPIPPLPASPLPPPQPSSAIPRRSCSCVSATAPSTTPSPVNSISHNDSVFTSTDRPLELSAQSDVHLGRLDTPIYALPMGALLQRIHGPDPKRYLIELNNRFAFPAACLVLMLVGVPLGVASRRGGKSSGFVYTILLVSLYYFLSLSPHALGRQNKLPAFLAVWSANILFAAVGIFLLWQMASGGQVLATITAWFSRDQKHDANGQHFSLTGFRDRLQLRSLRAKITPRLSPHPRRIRRSRIPQHVPPRPLRLRPAHAGLHLL